MTSSQPVCMGCFVNPEIKPSEYFSIEKNGLTQEEKDCASHLMSAWNKFLALDKKHPSDDAEFLKAIHDAQKMIALRVARRVDPNFWKTDFPVDL